MTEETYKYRAFVSYRHVDRDRRWAKWLVNSLETYRTPKALIALGIAERIGKLFRDDDEIPASADLNSQIHDALKASEYLIVICSPDTPKSKWVCREIQLFQSLGRGDRIIPLLVEGEPAQSFPEELLQMQRKRIGADGQVEEFFEEIEPLAGDVRSRSDESHSVTKHRALIRVAAALLRVKFDDLAQRESQREKRRRRTRNAISAAIVFLIAGAGGYWWDYTRVKTSYFVEYGSRWGIPFGVGEVSAEQSQRMSSVYKLEYQRRQLVRMSAVKGGKHLASLVDGYTVEPWLEGVAQWEFQYDPDGDIDQIALLNDKSREILVQEWTMNGQTATVFFQTNISGTASAVSIRTSSDSLGASESQVRTPITQNVISFDEAGLIKRREFRNNYSYPQADDQGLFGRAYSYDEEELLSSISFLGLENQPAVTKGGLASIEITRRTSYEIETEMLVDQNGDALIGSQGFASITYKYDESGNNIETAYYGLDNLPTLSNLGLASFTGEYDARGNLVAQAFYGLDGQPASNFGIASIVAEYDARGNTIATNYFGADGQPTLSNSGIASVTIEHDAHGNRVSESYFGVDGQPTINNAGYASIATEYDARGNRTATFFFGLDGQPTPAGEGNASRTSEYDARGNLVSQSYFGVDGNPTLNNNGYASITTEHDAHGNRVSESYFGVDGQPTTLNAGYASIATEYDARGNRTATFFFGLDGQPTPVAEGYVSRTSEYDARGNLVSQSYFGVDGQPMVLNTGYASITTEYDDRGNRTATFFFGLDGQPTPAAEGYASSTNEYDARGNLVSQSYFGVDGELTLTSDGYASVTREYDALGNTIADTYYGLDGRRLED